jgi:hypothetical protein
MTTFVLIHGAWHGGWSWRLVADRLAALRRRQLPSSYITCTGWAAVFAPYAQKARDLGWPVREIEADHEALATAPDLLAGALLDSVAGQAMPVTRTPA